MPYLESASQSLKSKFGALADRFKNLTRKRQNLPSDHEVKVEKMPAISSSSPDWLTPYGSSLAGPFDATQWPISRYNGDPWWPSTRLNRMDADLWNFGELMWSMEEDIDTLMGQAGSWMGKNDIWMTPWVQLESEGKYRANIPIGKGFRPDYVEVSLRNGMVTVKARKERVDDTSRFYQEIVRRVSLPSCVKEDEVKSVLSPEGYLTLEAPLPEEAGEVEEEEKVRSERVGPVQAA